MKRALIALAVTASVLAAATTRAEAAATVSAQVDSVATVTSQVTTVFDFDLYNCPPGLDIAIVEWEAHQPSRPESFAGSGFQPYGLSNGDPVQHLTLITGSAAFLPGEQWIGSGTIACGAVLIPVEGHGTTQSLNGV
jgi:hypothetical protein